MPFGRSVECQSGCDVEKWRIESEQVNPFFPDSVGKSLSTNCHWWELELVVRLWANSMGWNSAQMPRVNLELRVDNVGKIVPTQDAVTRRLSTSLTQQFVDVVSSGVVKFTSGTKGAFIDAPVAIEDGLSWIGEVAGTSLNFVRFALLPANRLYGNPANLAVAVNPNLNAQIAAAPVMVWSSLTMRRGYLN